MEKNPIKALALVDENNQVGQPLFIQHKSYSVLDVTRAEGEVFIELEAEENDEVNGVITTVEDEHFMFVYEGDYNE